MYLPDNNLPCIAEKEIVAVDSICDELMRYMVEEQGCYLASKEVQDKLIATVFTEEGALNRKCVGEAPRRCSPWWAWKCLTTSAALPSEGPRGAPADYHGADDADPSALSGRRTLRMRWNRPYGWSTATVIPPISTQERGSDYRGTRERWIPQFW